MAMNNISFLVSSEKDSLLAFKDNSLANGEGNLGEEFLSQLNEAHNSMGPLLKGNKNPDAENSIASLKNEESSVETETSNTSNGSPTHEVIIVYGDSMLAQINSAQAINTSVSKPAEKVDGATDEVDFKKRSTIDSSIDYIAIEKSISKVVSESKNIPSINSSVTVSAAEITQITERDKSTAVDTSMTQDTDLIKADKILDSLTPEQMLQLNLQIQALDKPSNINNITALKQMLAQFITDNEKAQSTVAKHSFSAEINSLNTTEKQSLLTQLNAYIKTEQPKGEQLSVLKQTVNELKASIEIGLADTAKSDSKTFVASETPNTVYDPEKLSLKASTNEGADINKAVATSAKRDDLLKSLEELQKDGLRKTSAEQTPARVAQVFTQITAALNTQQTSTLSQYDSLSYEQSLLDTQIIQTQQLQSTSQVKQVSIDPGVMQAINIVKSDAAKLLQERVSSMLSINNKEAEIRLDPPEMGSMQIRIRSDAEQAHINFVVQNQQAKEALEQSMPRLREMLAQQGLELGESTISYGQSGGETAEQSESGAQGNLANNKSVNDENDEQANNTAQSSRQQTSSSIDYYA
ncbi:flagellar hook-length control protein FliK [Pseudoalteromonas distincta]|uniref:flagellar hook-length control protein FliK n=1 Tax=Pseudoalteromonas distincta TaxID=77608 RepID=UPI0018697A4A|nr:flagellar hook-length control protein FliK [Pseudoalteromonas distincta]MBE3674306.1 flagellar hook-length control protein FliK [Pseudoalteromonas distincta KMM 3548]